MKPPISPETTSSSISSVSPSLGTQPIIRCPILCLRVRLLNKRASSASFVGTEGGPGDDAQLDRQMKRISVQLVKIVLIATQYKSPARAKQWLGHIEKPTICESD